MSTAVAKAESPSEADALLRAIEQRYDVLNALIFAYDADEMVASPAPSLIDTAGVSQREEAVNAAIASRVDAEIGSFKSNWGLQLTGQTYYRLDGVVGFDEDDPQSRYNGKFQIQARWYFLQSSLFKRQGNIRAIELQGDIDRTLQQRDRLDISVYRQKEYFRQVSDSLLSGVLQHRIANLSLLAQAQLYMLERGEISSDELLKILDDKATAERQLVTLPAGLPPATDLRGLYAVSVEVDTAAMIKYIEDTAVDMQLLRLRLDLLRQQEENTSYWSQCNLAPFVRYSYYLREYSGNSSNVDAGLSFTIPINTTASHQRRVLQAQRQVLEAENMNLMEEVRDKVRYYGNEIDRLNRASAGEVNRMEELKGYLTMRARAYNNRNGEYNRLSRLKEYNNYLSCVERLISLQYQRDCYVADLQRLLNTASVLEFCEFKEIK